MSVGNNCVREVDLAEADESIQVAAGRMYARAVGTLVILNEQREPIGIVTDRDLVVRALAKGLDPVGTTVGEVMSPIPVTVKESETIEVAISAMRRARCRRLPVVSDLGKLLGLISLDDVLEILGEELRQIGHLIEEEGPASLART